MQEAILCERAKWTEECDREEEETTAVLLLAFYFCEESNPLREFTLKSCEF